MQAGALGGHRRIVLLGAGAQAREIASYLPPDVEVVYAVNQGYDAPAGVAFLDLDQPPASETGTVAVGAVGPPGLRRDMVASWPGTSFAVVRATGAHVDGTAVLGPGSVISPQAVVSVGVTLGAHTQVNIGATLSHDVVCGEYVTIAPGVNVGGNARVADGAFLGIGSCVVNDVRIAPGVVVGAGAVVLHDVDEPNAVVAGVPARTIGHNTGWTHAV